LFFSLEFVPVEHDVVHLECFKNDVEWQEGKHYKDDEGEGEDALREFPPHPERALEYVPHFVFCYMLLRINVAVIWMSITTSPTDTNVAMKSVRPINWVSVMLDWFIPLSVSIFGWALVVVFSLWGVTAFCGVSCGFWSAASLVRAAARRSSAHKVISAATPFFLGFARFGI
jgi:fatty acid desaturase